MCFSIIRKAISKIKKTKKHQKLLITHIMKTTDSHFDFFWGGPLVYRRIRLVWQSCQHVPWKCICLFVEVVYISLHCPMIASCCMLSYKAQRLADVLEPCPCMCMLFGERWITSSLFSSHSDYVSLCHACYIGGGKCFFHWKACSPNKTRPIVAKDLTENKKHERSV